MVQKNCTNSPILKKRTKSNYYQNSQFGSIGSNQSKTENDCNWCLKIFKYLNKGLVL